MKFLGALLLAFLASGSDAFRLGKLLTAFQVDKLGEGLVLTTTTTLDEFLAPLRTVQKDLKEIYGRTKSNYKTKGLEMLSTDDCLALSNSTQVAYEIAVNATEFAVASVKEISSSLNEIVNCPSKSILPDRVIRCMFDQLKIVRQQILDTEASFTPYKNQAVQLYSEIVSEIHACAGF